MAGKPEVISRHELQEAVDDDERPRRWSPKMVREALIW
jgi:hypothetical protein